MAILYSNKIKDPNSTSVKPDDKYLLCRRADDRWFVIESQPSLDAAVRARRVLAAYEKRTKGKDKEMIPTWMVFNKDECHIKETLNG